MLGGDKAERPRLKKEEKVRATRAKAEAGDARAIRRLGYWHEHGWHGLEQNEAIAYSWYKRGADLGDATSLAAAGQLLLLGSGVKQNLTHGMFLMARAADKGSFKTLARKVERKPLHACAS
eukprot:2857438-Prymnesium_polylepis.1